MSHVEYVRLKTEEYILLEMDEIVSNNPDAARALFIPLSVYQLIEVVVAPIFIILEELYLMLSGQEWDEWYLTKSVIQLICFPFIIPVLLLYLLSGLSDPMNEIQDQLESVEGGLRNDCIIEFRNEYPSFSKDVDNFYERKPDINPDELVGNPKKVEPEPKLENKKILPAMPPLDVLLQSFK